MKLLLLLNETAFGLHSDVHNAIKYLADNKTLEDFIIYPFLAKLKEGKKVNEVLAEILTISEKYLPDGILWMHTEKLAILKEYICELKQLSSMPVIGYWDGDLYQSPYRPVPKQLLTLVVNCDVVFLQGFGEMSELFIKRGVKDLRYVPAFGDPKRFFPIQAPDKKEFDVVMIGNNIISRNPLRVSMPGTLFRNKIVKTFSKEFGKRFAVYGNNWKGESAKGTLNYNEQNIIYSKAKIAVSINNYTGKYYFSDRLPIAMLSGIPVLHNYEEGFGELFKNCEGLYFCNSIEDAVNKANYLLNKDGEMITELGRRLNSYALQRFTADTGFKYMIDVLKEKKQQSANKIPNPWLE